MEHAGIQGDPWGEDIPEVGHPEAKAPECEAPLIWHSLRYDIPEVKAPLK